MTFLRRLSLISPIGSSGGKLVKNRARRAKRLLDVQHQLLRIDLVKLQTLQQAMTAAQKTEDDAFSLLNAEVPPQIPVEMLLRMAGCARAKISAHRSVVDSQKARTLEQARREAVAKRSFDAAAASLSELEAKQALQAAIDAFLCRHRR